MPLNEAIDLAYIWCLFPSQVLNLKATVAYNLGEILELFHWIIIKKVPTNFMLIVCASHDGLSVEDLGVCTQCL